MLWSDLVVHLKILDMNPLKKKKTFGMPGPRSLWVECIDLLISIIILNLALEVIFHDRYVRLRLSSVDKISTN